MLTNAELNEARKDYQITFLTSTATIKTKTTTTGPNGPQTTYARSSPVPCRFEGSGGPNEGDNAATIIGKIPFNVYLPWGTVVLAKDLIEIQSMTFEVIGLAGLETESICSLAYCIQIN